MQKETIGDCELYLGDCLDVMPTLGKVDAVVTDPPYGIGERSGTISKIRNRNNYIGYNDTEANVISGIIPRVKMALDIASCSIITPGGKCLFYYPKPVDIGMFYQPASCGMTHWGRTTCQPILFYGKDPMVGKTIQPLHYQLIEKTDNNGHPCPKPLGAMKWLVSRASLLGQTILDPFMGSGTTGVACANMGRKFIGIELEPKYFDIACRRIEEAYKQPDMFISAAKKPQQDSFV